jgi:hypothetical protein
VLLAALGLLACSVSGELTGSERALLLTEADFRLTGRAADAPLQGKYRKMTNQLDKSRELSYVYEKEGSGFYLSNTLTLDFSPGNALITEGAQKAGLMIGLTAAGVSEDPIELTAKYGDRASLTLLRKEGKPIGNVFTAVAGKKVFVVVFSGVYFDDAAVFDGLIAPKWDAIMRFDTAK